MPPKHSVGAQPCSSAARLMKQEMWIGIAAGIDEAEALPQSLRTPRLLPNGSHPRHAKSFRGGVKFSEAAEQVLGGNDGVEQFA